MYVVNIKSKVEISSIFVAFLENLNFNIKSTVKGQKISEAKYLLQKTIEIHF